MKNFKILFSVLLFFSFTNENAFAQVPTKLLGEWHIYELTSDRFYKNFETDSIFLFEKEDQMKMNDEALQKYMKEVFTYFKNFTINIEKDNVMSFSVGTELTEKYKFTYDVKLSILTFTKENEKDSITVNSENIMVYDVSDEYEKRIFTLKKKSK